MIAHPYHPPLSGSRPTFASGKAGLDTARFDVDSDGVAESLYRVPFFVRSSNGSSWEVELCDDITRFPRLRISVDPAEAGQRLSKEYARRLVDDTSTVGEFIKYNGTSYHLQGSETVGSLMETRKDGFGINQYVMKRDWWFAWLYTSSRTVKGDVNLTWPDMDRKK